MDYFSDMSWNDWLKDIVDVAIVSYIIFKLILLVRGTRAIQLLKGILMLVGTWVISIWLDLYTLQWLMNQMFTFGVVTVLIIFQPELRRALEQLGRGRLFSRTYIESKDEMQRINDILRAVNYLAKRKIGALIVFERSTGLNEYIESGTKMESRISSQLIGNIFVPNTPLHDGALIIRGHQIMAAGCYLPLSENPSISKELGTRHRAAIGITEVCDAVSVIVSEETGQISLAVAGGIIRDMRDELLVTKLLEELNPDYKKHREKEETTFWTRWRRRL